MAKSSWRALRPRRPRMRNRHGARDPPHPAGGGGTARHRAARHGVAPATAALRLRLPRRHPGVRARPRAAPRAGDYLPAQPGRRPRDRLRAADAGPLRPPDGCRPASTPSRAGCATPAILRCWPPPRTGRRPLDGELTLRWLDWYGAPPASRWATPTTSPPGHDRDARLG